MQKCYQSFNTYQKLNPALVLIVISRFSPENKGQYLIIRTREHVYREYRAYYFYSEHLAAHDSPHFQSNRSDLISLLVAFVMRFPHFPALLRLWILLLRRCCPDHHPETMIRLWLMCHRCQCHHLLIEHRCWDLPSHRCSVNYDYCGA